MSIEKDAAETLAEVIARHAQSGNVIQFPRKSQVRATPQISNHGDGNAVVVGSNNTVTVNVTRRTVIAEVKPGTVHISDAQAARLKQLVHQVAAATKWSFQRIWTVLLDTQAVPRYRLIPAAGYPSAEQYMLDWLTRLAGDDKLERKRHIRYIKTNERTLGRGPLDLVLFLGERFGKAGLRECTTSELGIVRRDLVGKWLTESRRPT